MEREGFGRFRFRFRLQTESQVANRAPSHQPLAVKRTDRRVSVTDGVGVHQTVVTVPSAGFGLPISLNCPSQPLVHVLLQSFDYTLLNVPLVLQCFLSSYIQDSASPTPTCLILLRSIFLPIFFYFSMLSETDGNFFTPSILSSIFPVSDTIT